MADRNTVRLFVSCDMPDEVRRIIMNFQQALKNSALCQAAYVDPSHAHVTLAFLGDVEADDIATIDEALRAIKARTGVARLSSIDWFEHEGEIRIVFINVVCPMLNRLAHTVINELSSWLPRDKRSFVSHLTVARIKKVHDSSALREFLTAYQIEPVAFEISSFALIKSEPTAQGPIHSQLMRYELQKQVFPK